MAKIFKHQFHECNDIVHKRPKWRESLSDAISKSTSWFKSFSESPLTCQSRLKTCFIITESITEGLTSCYNDLLRNKTLIHVGYDCHYTAINQSTSLSYIRITDLIRKTRSSFCNVKGGLLKQKSSVSHFG